MKNLLLRTAQTKDLEAIYQLAKESGYGLTTLPKDRAILAERIEQHAYYLFVLEDTSLNQVIGTSAIQTKAGCDAPFYAYKVSKRIKSVRGDKDKLLLLVNDQQDCTELCTLYLSPDYRIDKWGSFLSRARFLFLAEHPEQFAKTVIAEMRGVANSKGESPFWNAVGQHFFHLSFVEADKLTLTSDKQFIADHMPEFPIYVKLLPKAAQQAIGKAHKSTVPAMCLLEKEGFFYNHYIDIFDAGPMVESPLAHIHTVKFSETYTFKTTQKEIDSPVYMISNTSEDFKAMRGPALLTPEGQCILTAETAQGLQLKSGDAVRIALF